MLIQGAWHRLWRKKSLDRLSQSPDDALHSMRKKNSASILAILRPRTRRRDCPSFPSQSGRPYLFCRFSLEPPFSGRALLRRPCTCPERRSCGSPYSSAHCPGRCAASRLSCAFCGRDLCSGPHHRCQCVLISDGDLPRRYLSPDSLRASSRTNQTDCQATDRLCQRRNLRRKASSSAAWRRQKSLGLLPRRDHRLWQSDVWRRTI